jgi:hypothetical protein
VTKNVCQWLSITNIMLENPGQRLSRVLTAASSILRPRTLVRRQGRGSSSAKRLLTCVVISTHLCACVATRHPNPVASVVSETQRSRLGVVGVVQIAGGPKGELHAGARGAAAGAAQGAATGAGIAAGAASGQLYSSSCSGKSAIVCVILIPVFIAAGAVVGGAVGAAQAVPTDTAQQIEAQLNSALTEVGPQDALRADVVKAAVRADVPDVKEIAEGTTMADYRPLSKSKVDTVLEVGVVEVGLTGNGGKDPQLTLHVRAVARLVDVNSNMELYRNYALNHVSGPRKFSEWGADQAHLLKHELGRAYEDLGTSIVEEVFLVVRTH